VWGDGCDRQIVNRATLAAWQTHPPGRGRDCNEPVGGLPALVPTCFARRCVSTDAAAEEAGQARLRRALGPAWRAYEAALASWQVKARKVRADLAAHAERE
jgi:hypothetical protein